MTRTAAREALDTGFRHFDYAKRYRNEREVGPGTKGIAREHIFVTTKLWNSDRRPERVEPAFEASLDRLRRLDLYLIHTLYTFQPGDEQDHRYQNGNVLYDNGVTLLGTRRAMESLVDHDRDRATGLSDISLNELLPISESARIKPAMVQVESHPYLPETELLEFCKEKGIVFLAFAPSGDGNDAGFARRPRRCSTARLCLPHSKPRLAGERILTSLFFRTRQRLNEVVKTGSWFHRNKVDEHGSQTTTGAVHGRKTNR